MKLAFVVPRYGTEILGGAETGARLLAEHLVADLDWEVEVFTTCAREALTWRDEYAPGTVTLNGVLVHRMASLAGRHEDFHPYSGALLQAPEQASRAEGERWIDLQGPRCPELVAAVAACDAEVVAFYPYLYYPTVRGLPAVAARSVLHPAAHDEPPLRLGVFDPVFAAAAGLVFHTYSERRLVLDRFGVARTPQTVLGLGVDERPGEEGAAREALGLGTRPYLLCLGRVEPHKGTDLLARCLATYKARRGGPLALVLAGPVVEAPPSHPDVILAGPVDEATKWGLLRGALALVSPSPWESFSLTVVEGWAAGAPVVVNALCAATREHCERSGGGLWFADYGHLEVILDRLTDDVPLRAVLAAQGRRYVDANFRWPVVVERYAAFVRDVAELMARPGGG